MIKILVVEDEKPIANLISMNLEDAGYRCTCAYNGMVAADIIEANAFDLILLDIMLPEVNGYELLEFIRPLEIPVIFITAKGDINDRVKGLELGAEDYIVKPFEIAELLARVHVVLRRYNKMSNIIKVKNVMIDTDNQVVKKDGKEITLTPREYALLLLFFRNQNMTMFRERIYETIWGGNYDDNTRSLDLHVQRIRKKTGLSEIKTVYGVGYRLENGEEE